MKRIVDLTHPITGGMPVYPGDPAVEVERARTAEDSDWNVTRVSLGTHAGTHIDAPFHCIPGAPSVDRISLDVLVGWAEIIDLGEPAADSDINAAMLEPFSDRVSPGCRILLRTGWSRRLGRPEFFSNHPNLTRDAAEWLVDRKIALLGMEQPSVNTGDNLAVHKIILAGGIALIENVANLDQVSCERVYLAALPLNLIGTDGAPIRVVAWKEAPV